MKSWTNSFHKKQLYTYIWTVCDKYFMHALHVN